MLLILMLINVLCTNFTIKFITKFKRLLCVSYFKQTNEKEYVSLPKPKSQECLYKAYTNS